MLSHDVGTGKLTVFIDGKEKLRTPGRGGGSHCFKFVMYAQRHAFSCMESRWKGIMIRIVAQKGRWGLGARILRFDAAAEQPHLQP